MRHPPVRSMLFVLAAAVASPALAADPKSPAPATQPAATPKLDVEAFDKARQQPGAIVLDVRSPDEFADGHVPGAVNIPVAGKEGDKFDKAVAALPKDKPLLVHCRSGVRSAKAIAKLREMGFTNLSEFPGGWVAWAKAEKPAVKGAGGGEAPKNP
ncbi:MAG TPA: rhodanese-like domain-containing protein [Humisphaera sp.]